MSIGFGLLHLAPDHFWAMTIPEFEAAVSGMFGDRLIATPLARDELLALMHRFPDERETRKCLMK